MPVEVSQIGNTAFLTVFQVTHILPLLSFVLSAHYLPVALEGKSLLEKVALVES